MIAERRTPGNSAGNCGAGRPRVVLLADDEPRVEVLDLPDNATVGTSFEHRGVEWHITGSRTKSRVLIAEPTEH